MNWLCLVCGNGTEWLEDEWICQVCRQKLVVRSPNMALDDDPLPSFWTCWSLFYSGNNRHPGGPLGDC